MRRSRRTFLTYSLIIAISIVLALYLVCYVIGSTVWLEFDPYRFYRLRPNASAEETFQGRKIRIEINSLGFRDREFHIEKPEGTFRIMAAGDSSTFGLNISLEETYPRQLESLLNEQVPGGPHFEVINAGVLGYSSLFGLVYIERELLDYDPDVLIVSYCANDEASSPFPLREVVSLDGPTPLTLAMTRGGDRRFSLLKLLIIGSQILRFQIFQRELHNPGQEGVTKQEYQYILERIISSAQNSGTEVIFLCIGCNKTQSYTALMKDTALRQGVPIIVDAEIFPNRPASLRNSPQLVSLMEQVEERVGREVLDRPESAYLYLRVDEGHPNEVGNRLIANALAEIVIHDYFSDGEGRSK